MSLNTKILIVDQAHTPSREWADFDAVASYYSKGRALYALGETVATLRGGYNKDGVQSVIEVPSILVVKGFIKHYREACTIPLSKDALFKRDRCVCGYCGLKFKEKDLRMEHIFPEARGGKATWMNMVAACEPCNSRKACRTPQEAGMDPVYLPYTPNRHEGLILQNRKILADQMDYLVAGLPKHSRLL